MALAIGEYESDQPIASGSVIDVHRGHHRTTGAAIALKVVKGVASLPPHAQRDYHARFLEAASKWASIKHIAVVDLLDYGISGAHGPYLVLQLVDGASLDNILRSAGTFGSEDVARIGARMAQVLAYAHASGVVHGRIRPSNLLRGSDGEVWLTDLCTARLTEDVFSQAGRTPLNPGFAAPEQLSGSTGPATDLFSLGATLYSLLTGRGPFVGDSPEATRQALLTADPRPPSALRPDLDVAWDGILLRALARDPGQRFADAAALAAALGDLASGGPQAPADTQQIPMEQLEETSPSPAPAVGGEEPSFSLVVVGGPDKGKRVAVDGVLELGRGQGLLPLTDPTVSSRHCRIERVGEQIAISDHGSLNGTWVKREKVSSATVADGDVFVVGTNTRVRVERRSAAAMVDLQIPDALEVSADALGLMEPVSAGPTYLLNAIAGPLASRSFAVSGEVVIGRDQGDVPLMDNQVSRRHAKLDLRDPNRVVLSDLGSRNGTFVGEQQIQTAVIKFGTEFRCGTTVLKLQPPS